MNFIDRQDKDVSMGIRPEKLKISVGNEKEEDVFSLDECYVEAVELVGAEKLIYFDRKGLKLVSKVPEEIQTVKGNSYSLYCRKNDIHYFDRQKGERIIL
jgi:ABC-type sugar transport system ATPase subunit